MGQNRQRIGADFIRHVAVGGDTVGADPHASTCPCAIRLAAIESAIS